MKIYENENINCSVGAMEQGTNKQLFHDVLYISKTEASIELRIFVDQTFHRTKTTKRARRNPTDNR